MDSIPTPPLYNAALRGDLDTVRSLLAAGVDPDIPCTEDCLAGETPLMAALFSEQVEIAHTLLAAGATINAAVASKFAHVSHFLFNGRHTDAMLQLLLEYGLNPNEELEWGNTLLMSFAGNPKCRNCVPIILDHGAELEARDKRHQRTAFMYAALAGEGESLRLLQERGADINAQDAHGHTALMQIIIPRATDDDMLMLTHEHAELRFYKYINGAPRDTEEMLPRLRLLLACGVDTNVRDHRGWNALLYSLAIGQTEAARMLTEHGATLDSLAPGIIHRARCCMELHGYTDALHLLDERHAPNATPPLAPIPSHRRNFFIRRDQCRGTAYINLQRGSFSDDNCGWCDFSWNIEGDAPSISDDDIYTSGLAYILESILPEYSPYDNYNISREQWDAICARADELGGKPAHAVNEIRTWVNERFDKGEGVRIFGV